LRRFFVEEIGEGKGTLILRGAEANHIRTVLRMAPGDRLVLTDSKGARYEAVIVSLDRHEVGVNLERPLPPPLPSPVEITLCQALLRSHPMDMIIQKTSELGVDCVLPFLSERTIVKPDQQAAAGKLRHWREIALSATKQSGRLKPAEIGPLSTFSELVGLWRGEEAMKVVLWEDESVRSLKSLLRSTSPPRKAVAVIGPEGGFSDEEIERCGEAGFVSTSLGQRILRAETAAITLVSLFQYEWGDLG
jgi:16S rRNA (uracil1498-N3)-methyltransferase